MKRVSITVDFHDDCVEYDASFDPTLTPAEHQVVAATLRRIMSSLGHDARVGGTLLNGG